jgi:hypothetical protein
MGAFAYRSGEELVHKGIIYDYNWRSDVLHSEIVLPENASLELKNRQTLWGAVEKVEDNSTRWKTARVAHEFILALPRELELPSWIIICREFIETHLLSKGMIVDFNIHRGDPKDSGHHEANHKEIDYHNPHCHIATTTRHIANNRFNDKKAREWESYGNSALLKQWRKAWANIQNKMFERKGIPIRVSHERSAQRENERD